MPIRANKPEFNLREKLKELEKPIGLKGSELMRAETAQEARDLVSAGRKNLIINGAMQVWQRGTSKLNLTTHDYYTADRWIAGTNSGSIDMEQSTDTPPGFGYSLKISVNTTGSSTGNQSHIDYYIEAQDLQHLKWGTPEAEPITVSFWMKSTSTQTKYLWLYSQDAGDHIARPFSVKQANVWERISITVPGNTLGVIANDTGKGLYVRFTFDAGSTYTGGTPTTWTTLSNTRFSGIGNFMSDANNEFYLTGVQLEVGKNATEFEHRSYGEELALCQRYFYVLPSHYHFLHKNGYYETQLYYFPVTMRAAPNITDNGYWSIVGFESSSATIPLSVGYYTFPDGFYLGSTVTNNSNFYTWVHIDATIFASAEI